jgi:hypothetical protein
LEGGMLDREEKIVLDELVELYGEQNVEDTLMYICNAHDFRGLPICIQLEESLIRKILWAVHGPYLIRRWSGGMTDV